MGTSQCNIAAIVHISLLIEERNCVNDSATGGKPDISWLPGIINYMVDKTAVELEVGSGSDYSLNEGAKCKSLGF